MVAEGKGEGEGEGEERISTVEDSITVGHTKLQIHVL